MRKKEMKQDDNRKVVIYARKSKITHKGDSISNQEEYCKEYARLHLMLPEDYEFGIYEDEGKSGFYADRPDFQRMIRDVEHRKIKAIVCYKLDRISRRMSDLTNLIDYLNKYDVALLISSNNLNTMDSNSKMMVQMLGMIAEFERDIIAERLQDNLTELAKDGRWLGGITPTGYSAERSKYGSGKKKNAFTYLVTVPEEKALVEYIFSTFLSLRGLHATAVKLNTEGYTTKNGSSFTTLAVKDIIRNPVYCIADKTAYQYFLDKGSNVFGDIEEFDGVHGISVYNRTLQTKEESDDSTFLHPDFTASTKQKEPEEWIVAVGKHEGFIDSERWIEAQKLKEDIAEKYNQPHRSTNALLSGIMYCPECGSRLRVVSESNRYTHGKPRFKYSCPKAVRKGSCNYVAVHGVEMDEFIVDYLSKLKENEKDDYKAKLRAEIKRVYQSDSNEKEIRVMAKEIEKLERSIKAQVKALRTATAATRPYIQSDIDDMANEIAQKKQEQARLEEVSADSDAQVKEIEKTLTLIENFNEISEKDEPGEVISAIQSILERVYVIREDGKEKVKIFIKGAPKENYDSFFEEGVKATIGVDAMCDLDRNRECNTTPNHTGIIRKRDKVLIRMDSELPRVSELADPADKLRYYRESKGFSQEQLGNMLGNSSWFINNFEKRFNPIYYEDAVKFAEILEINPEELLDEYTRFCRPGYGKRICSIRKAYGLSQVKFAELVGTSRSTVSIWEAEINNHHPNREKYGRMKELAGQKGIDINDT